MQRKYLALSAAFAILLLQAQIASTQNASQESTSQETTDEDSEDEDRGWSSLGDVVQHGSATIPLRDQAKLMLPEGYGFIGKEKAAEIMKRMGNHTDERFIGMIVPLEKEQWFVTVDYENAGYIKDDDAKHWDAKELLESLKEGTEAGNDERKKMGIDPIVVSRWVEPPSYEAPTHRLVWSAEVRLKNGEDPDPTINYNTYVLGREGYIEMNLVTSTSTISTDKIAAHELLEAVAFNGGKTYGEYNSSTDKVAAYGLAALIGGIAAKKLGLLAVIGVFLAKFAKIIAVVVMGFGAGIMKWFRGKKDGE